MSSLDNGKFGAAFLSGFVSSAISSGIEALGQTDGGFVDGKTGKSIASYNNFGKSDWFKASIIVSGGVSGGISSRIAGGSFMDGFKQGLITAGLNHVASIVADGIGKDPLQKILDKNGIDPRKLATQETLDKLKVIFKEYWDGSAQWAEFANDDTIAQWEDSLNKISLDKDGAFLTEKGRAVALTNDLSGKVLFSKILFGKTNYYLASTFIHEQVHSIDIISGFSKGLWGNPIENDIMEFRAYNTVMKWTGYMESTGIKHLSNIMNFYMLNFR